MQDYEFTYYDEGTATVRTILIPARNIWDAIEVIKASYAFYKSKFPVTEIKEI